MKVEVNTRFYSSALVVTLSCVVGGTVAQPVLTEAQLCMPDNIGSAVGATECYAAELRNAENELVKVEAGYASQIMAMAANPYSTKRALEADAAAWRVYRDAKCELYGETEGGSERWKGAMAIMCEAKESSARIAMLRNSPTKK